MDDIKPQIIRLLEEVAQTDATIQMEPPPWDDERAPRDLFVVDLLAVLHPHDNSFYLLEEASYSNLVMRMFVKVGIKAKAWIRAPRELQTKHEAWINRYNMERPQGMRVQIPAEMKWLYVWMLEVSSVKVAVRRRISRAAAVEELKRDVLDAQKARLELIEEILQDPHKHQKEVQDNAKTMRAIAKNMNENDWRLFLFWEPLIDYLFAEFDHSLKTSNVKAQSQEILGVLRDVRGQEAGKGGGEPASENEDRGGESGEEADEEDDEPILKPSSPDMIIDGVLW